MKGLPCKILSTRVKEPLILCFSFDCLYISVYLAAKIVWTMLLNGNTPYNVYSHCIVMNFIYIFFWMLSYFIGILQCVLCIVCSCATIYQTIELLCAWKSVTLMLCENKVIINRKINITKLLVPFACNTVNVNMYCSFFAFCHSTFFWIGFNGQ